MASEVLFIVNPISGNRKQKHIKGLLEKWLNFELFDPTIVFTKCQNHATELSRNAIGKYDYVVAVGGDGTVNEVANGLIGSNVVMGIIPVGSGNGLARHLNIPMNTAEAIKVLNKNLVMPIDTIDINGTTSVNVSGIGFDAHVAHKFASNGKRGPIPYVKITTTEFQQYHSQKYKVTVDGKTRTEDAFLISFANSAQFGNNIFIAPEAKINDGLIDVCIMEEFPIVDAPILATRLINKTIHKSQYLKTYRYSKLTIEASNYPILCHIDGEPKKFDTKLEIEIKPASLKIIYNNEQQIWVITTIEKEIMNLLNEQSSRAKTLINKASEILKIKRKPPQITK